MAISIWHTTDLALRKCIDKKVDWYMIANRVVKLFGGKDINEESLLNSSN